ncbi:MAG: hypothetical protein J0I12_12995 [Candidatus Eremiobacteraeota bacterium]|nr:hypothetical protein [Candidatus Eremiobacteraeota bacterium]
MRDQQLLKMHQAVTGSELVPEADAQVLWGQVQAGNEDVLLSLHWFAGQSDFHSLTLNRVEGERMHFHNPIRSYDEEVEPGSELRDDAPARIFHGPGDESVDRGEFESWFAEREALGYVAKESVDEQE